MIGNKIIMSTTTTKSIHKPTLLDELTQKISKCAIEKVKVNGKKNPTIATKYLK